MRTLRGLLTWLEAAVPAIVLQYLIKARAVKVCSNVSPAFAVIARANGFQAYQVAGINHYYNVVETLQGPVEIDLSYIQFSVCGSRKSVKQAVQRLIRDPWEAVRIRPYDGPLHELMEPRISEIAGQQALEGYVMALDDVEGLRAQDPEIIEEFEDLYPWFKTEEWESESNPQLAIER